jgi:hypothetical protein
MSTLMGVWVPYSMEISPLIERISASFKERFPVELIRTALPDHYFPEISSLDHRCI